MEKVCSYSQPQKHMRLGGGGAFPSSGLPVFTEHLPWARPVLVATALRAPGLAGWRGMRGCCWGPRRAWGLRGGCHRESSLCKGPGARRSTVEGAWPGWNWEAGEEG